MDYGSVAPAEHQYSQLAHVPHVWLASICCRCSIDTIPISVNWRLHQSTAQVRTMQCSQSHQLGPLRPRHVNCSKGLTQPAFRSKQRQAGPRAYHTNSSITSCSIQCYWTGLPSGQWHSTATAPPRDLHTTAQHSRPVCINAKPIKPTGRHTKLCCNIITGTVHGNPVAIDCQLHSTPAYNRHDKQVCDASLLVVTVPTDEISSSLIVKVHVICKHIQCMSSPDPASMMQSPVKTEPLHSPTSG